MCEGRGEEVDRRAVDEVTGAGDGGCQHVSTGDGRLEALVSRQAGHELELLDGRLVLVRRAAAVVAVGVGAQQGTLGHRGGGGGVRGGKGKCHMGDAVQLARRRARGTPQRLRVRT